MAWELTREAMKGHEHEIEALKPFVAEIKDEKYERIYAKVVVSEDPERLPDGETLLIQDFRGKREPKEWRIKILEKLPTPYQEYL